MSDTPERQASLVERLKAAEVRTNRIAAAIKDEAFKIPPRNPHTPTIVGHAMALVEVEVSLRLAAAEIERMEKLLRDRVVPLLVEIDPYGCTLSEVRAALARKEADK